MATILILADIQSGDAELHRSRRVPAIAPAAARGRR
jgi:hypothetical protein